MIQLVPVRRYPLALTLFSTLLLVLTGCSEPAEEMKGGMPAVTVIKIEPQDTAVTSEFVGKTASSRRVEIRSRVEGFLDKREYTEGSMVEVGQVLFEMDKKPFEAQLKANLAELEQQEARKQTALTNLNRVRPLAKKNAVAQKELDDAQGMFARPRRRLNRPGPGWCRRSWTWAIAPSPRRSAACRVLPCCVRAPTSVKPTAC